jgi:hypothetical protein
MSKLKRVRQIMTNIFSYLSNLACTHYDFDRNTNILLNGQTCEYGHARHERIDVREKIKKPYNEVRLFKNIKEENVHGFILLLGLGYQ